MCKVEDERRCMSVVSFELVGLDSMCLKEMIRINLNSCGSLSSFPVAATTNYYKQVA